MNCERQVIQVVTDILDVFPDGAITKLVLKPRPMNLTIRREEPAQDLVIDQIGVVDQEHTKEELQALAVHLREYCVIALILNALMEEKLH